MNMRLELFRLKRHDYTHFVYVNSCTSSVGALFLIRDTFCCNEDYIQAAHGHGTLRALMIVELAYVAQQYSKRDSE